MTETFIQHNVALEVFNKREAADFLRVKVRTMDDWMHKKIVPFSKLPSGAVRFRRDHLLDFVAKYTNKQ